MKNVKIITVALTIFGFAALINAIGECPVNLEALVSKAETDNPGRRVVEDTFRERCQSVCSSTWGANETDARLCACYCKLQGAQLQKYSGSSIEQGKKYEKRYTSLKDYADKKNQDISNYAGLVK